MASGDGVERKAAAIQRKLDKIGCAEVCVDPKTNRIVVRPRPGESCPPGTLKKLLSNCTGITFSGWGDK